MVPFLGRKHGHAVRRIFLVAALALCALVSPSLALAAGMSVEDSERHRQLLRKAERDFSLGAYQDGLDAAREAFGLAEKTSDALGLATARLVEGNLLLALGDADGAAATLTEIVDQASTLASPELVLTAKVNLANSEIVLGDRASAIERYEEIHADAVKLGAKVIAARALTNRLRVRVDDGAAIAAVEEKAIEAAIRPLPRDADRALLAIHLGGTYLRALRRGQGDAAALAVRGDAWLREALVLADLLDEKEAAPRVRAQALGYLGGFYAAAGRLPEALSLTRRALLQSARGGVESDLFLWHRQSARIHARLGQRDESIEEYAAALRALESNRAAIARSLLLSLAPGERSSDLSGLYREYVDLLLRRAQDAKTQGARRLDLRVAQETLERLKGDELRDYFEDDCVARYQDKLKSVTTASFDAVVVYPVLLEDRLELLVSVGDELIQVVVPVERERVRTEVEAFRRLLEKRTTRQYLRPAEKIHKWLIEPIQPLLDRYDPRTLVFVPDGILRTIPMAALFDGEKYLIERYALGLTPGLELTDPKPFERAGRPSLVAGVSDAVQGFSSLPNVGREINLVHSILGGDRLLNRGFSRSELTKRIREKNFGLVHIASHAQFSGESGNGFMLAHDGRISFDALADAVGASRYREDPLELVILSACETAQGDERAALGLSGIAIKAGARSALGTLWQVSDVATAEFMIRFYETLEAPGTSRADAVRAGQIRLLKDRQFAHPYYWSPFLLINSWL